MTAYLMAAIAVINGLTLFILADLRSRVERLENRLIGGISHA